MIEVYVILALVILVNAWQSHNLWKRIQLHQKALEWFSQHVDVKSEYLPKDAPKELMDLIKGKEVVIPENKP